MSVFSFEAMRFKNKHPGKKWEECQGTCVCVYVRKNNKTELKTEKGAVVCVREIENNARSRRQLKVNLLCMTELRQTPACCSVCLPACLKEVTKSDNAAILCLKYCVFYVSLQLMLPNQQ